MHFSLAWLMSVMLIGQAMAANSQTQYSNELIHESSPYLLQHAHNPVHWYAWGDAAFAKAKKEDKVIFLSIGYSTCHWCHVMEEDVFADEEAAAWLNEAFVAIKVDREERPDIDQLYMKVAQIMNGSGGWPLTILMTPDKKPFFAASYIPKEGGAGRLGMRQLVPAVLDAWHNQRQNIESSASDITEALIKESAVSASSVTLNKALLDQTFVALKADFDPVYGGFGQQRKFPSVHSLRYLLRHWQRTGEASALAMVEKSVVQMSLGGIQDHIGGGFHRYATDRQWKLPHFEKMLYDQALIAVLAIETWQATGNIFYADMAKRIFKYVLREMRSAQGAFYSAQDADSEGAEGLFYLWTEKDIDAALDKRSAALFKHVYHIQTHGNFPDEATGEYSGQNVLFRKAEWSALAKTIKLPESELRGRMKKARAVLFKVRSLRIRPFLDDKQLTDWNGLMIAALAIAGRALQVPEYSQVAAKAADFFLKNMRTPEGRLWHRYRNTQAGVVATLNDYAFFVWSLIELYQANMDVKYLQAAVDLNQTMLNDFADAQHGGLFLTAIHAEQLLVRAKEVSDGARPSGNSIALLNQLRLFRLTGDAALQQQANHMIQAFIGRVQQFPTAYTQFIQGLDFVLADSLEVVIVGDPSQRDTQQMLQAIAVKFLPNSTILLRSADHAKQLDQLAPFSAGYAMIHQKATAYVCRNFACHAPTNDIEKMLELFTSSRP